MVKRQANPARQVIRGVTPALSVPIGPAPMSFRRYAPFLVLWPAKTGGLLAPRSLIQSIWPNKAINTLLAISPLLSPNQRVTWLTRCVKRILLVTKEILADLNFHLILPSLKALLSSLQSGQDSDHAATSVQVRAGWIYPDF